MATEENKPTERVVLIAVDGSQNSEKAFECKFTYFYVICIIKPKVWYIEISE